MASTIRYIQLNVNKYNLQNFILWSQKGSAQPELLELDTSKGDRRGLLLKIQPAQFLNFISFNNKYVRKVQTSRHHVVKIIFLISEQTDKCQFVNVLLHGNHLKVACRIRKLDYAINLCKESLRN